MKLHNTFTPMAVLVLVMRNFQVSCSSYTLTVNMKELYIQMILYLICLLLPLDIVMQEMRYGYIRKMELAIENARINLIVKKIKVVPIHSLAVNCVLTLI